MPHQTTRRTPHRNRAAGARHRLGASLLVALAAAAGCATPLHPDSEPELRRSILGAIRRDTQGATVRPPAADPAYRPVVAPDRVQSLGLPPEILQKLNDTSGPTSYQTYKGIVGPDLFGVEQQIATVSLK
ncbi:MAG TPA: hypothetical protein VEB22_14210, partial [Phycisphaerales bacterium]|nr:hypothetical protein [Phycisphaerales bacterium]